MKLAPLAIVAAFLVLGCANRARKVELVPSNPGDRCTATTLGDTLRIEVRSAKGIGSLEFRGDVGPKIRRLRLRLHLQGLESLRFSHGDTTLAIAVSSGAGNPVREELRTGDRDGSRPLDPGSPDWMTVRLVAAPGAVASIPLRDGWFEVDASRSYMSGRRAPFRVEWVDFYR